MVINLPKLTLGDDIPGTGQTGQPIQTAFGRRRDARGDGGRFGRFRRGRFVEVKETSDHGDEYKRDITDHVGDGAQRGPG
jgi:hypothetical protein